MATDLKEEFDGKYKRSRQLFQSLLKESELLRKKSNVNLIVSCEPDLVKLWQQHGSTYFNDLPLKISNGTIRQNLHSWREMLKFFNSQYNQSIIFGKFSEAFKMLAYEYELLSNYREILKYSPDENDKTLIEICLNLAKVLFALECYKEAVEYCELGRSYCSGEHSSIDLNLVFDQCDYKVGKNSSSDEDGSTNNDEPDNLPHCRKLFFNQVISKDTNVFRRVQNDFQARISRFIQLENYICKRNLENDQRNFEYVSKKFVVSSPMKKVSSTLTVQNVSSTENSSAQNSSSQSTSSKGDLSTKDSTNPKDKSTSVQNTVLSTKSSIPVQNGSEVKKTVQLPQKEERKQAEIETKNSRKKKKKNDKKKKKENGTPISLDSTKKEIAIASDDGGENELDETEIVKEKCPIETKFVSKNKFESLAVAPSVGPIETKFVSKNKFETLTVPRLVENLSVFSHSHFEQTEKENDMKLQFDQIISKIDRQHEKLKNDAEMRRKKSEEKQNLQTQQQQRNENFVNLKSNDLKVRKNPHVRNLPGVGQVYIWFGCVECAIDVGRGLYKVKIFSHKCAEDMPLFRSSVDVGDLWVWVRRRYPLAWDPDICRHVNLKGGCWRMKACHFAHSNLEKCLWAEDGKKRINLADLLEDEKDLWRKESPVFGFMAYGNGTIDLRSKQVAVTSPIRNNFQNSTEKFIETTKTTNAWSTGSILKTVNGETDDIFERIRRAKVKGDVLCEDVEFARLMLHKEGASSTVRVAGNERGKKLKWIFELVSAYPLKRVALMKTRFTHYFRIESRDGAQPDSFDCFGDEFIVGDSSLGDYDIRLEFLGTKTLGTYDQEIVFDFGPDRKMLRRLLTVNVGVQQQQDVALNRLSRMRDLLNLDNCWTKNNVDIVWISGDRNYTPPTTSELVTNWRYDVNETTFFPMMKKWVTAEEMRRRSILAKFRLKTVAQLGQLLKSDGRTIKPFPDGALFAQLEFDHPINEDYDVTDLLSGYCNNAFVGLADDKSRNQAGKRSVYEVDVVGRGNFGYEGLTQHSINLCLSVVFVRHYGLNAGDSIKLDVQFNLQHKIFESWHNSLDILTEKQFIHLIFPDLLKYFSSYSSGVFASEIINKNHFVLDYHTKWKNEGKNDEQCRVLRHVVLCALNNKFWVPPFVIFGPFGTGKTRMMAEAASILLTDSSLPVTKILICAHSNNTADMYLKHLKKYTGFSDGRLKQLIWRLFKRKDVSNVSNLPPFLKPFIRFDPINVNHPEKFKIENLSEVRVVICTLTGANVLTKLARENPGKVSFTHIFLDEAAQAMEIEALMPLCTATKTTCVVVAGDPFQLKPTIYLTECNQLLSSYLERLYRFYENQEIDASCVPKIFFNKVYRCHPDILDFVSKSFYGENLHLEPCAKVVDVAFKAIYFATAFGLDEISTDSISFRNEGEAMEVVAQVEYFIKNWPKQWGTVDIGIAVAHYDQVKTIQGKLREYEKRENKNFSGLIHVGKVILFQGKEFKVLIISTVRGRSILNGEQYEKGKLGFLDDSRLINTAMTRAQYCVVVVGDPIALASIGKCKNIWRQYIKFCYERNSFLPENYPMDLLKQHVADAEIKLNQTPV